MNAKFIIYILTTPLVIWAMDSLNINAMFKKNKVIQANAMYFLITLALIYLVANLIYDFFALANK